jgi:hypothetical protein
MKARKRKHNSLRHVRVCLFVLNKSIFSHFDKNNIFKNGKYALASAPTGAHGHFNWKLIIRNIPIHGT